MDVPAARETHYDAFVSYRRSDGTRPAYALRRRLQGFRLPKALQPGHAARLTVFLDTAYERGATDFYEETIRPALDASRWLIVLATPDAVKRPTGEDWIAREVADFSKGPNAKNVVVVRALGEFMDKLPADIAERYPNVQIVDLRGDTFFGRLSPQAHARIGNEMLKIVGPLFSIAVQDMPLLRREEERRQMTRRGLFSGAGAATVALATGLSLYALKAQVEGSRALKESLRVTQATITGMLDDYAEDEPVDSHQREIVVKNCDLVKRLADLSETPPADDVATVCRIEEGRALALADGGAPRLGPLQEAVEAAAAQAAKEDIREDGWMSAARDGWRTLALVAPQDQRDKALLALSDLESQRADREFATPVTGTNYLHAALVGWYVAAKLQLRLVAFHQDNSDRSPEHAKAAEALLAKALDAYGSAQDWDAGGAYWADLLESWTIAVQAVAQAQEKSNPDLARAAIDRGLDRLIYRPVPPGGQAAQQALHADMQMRSEQLASRLGDTARATAERWACLATASAFARVNASTFKEKVDAAYNDCINDFMQWIDTRREAADSQVEAKDFAHAEPSLRSVIDDYTQVIDYIPNPGPWPSLYRVIALSELARVKDGLGKTDEAEATRLLARDLYRPFMGKPDDDLSALRARLITQAWSAIWTGHHAFLDGLLNQAQSAPLSQAVSILRRLIDADNSWDQAMPSTTAWDDVYQAELNVRLAAAEDGLGNTAAAEKARSTACTRLSPHAPDFKLEASQAARARAAWAALKECLRQTGNLANLPPIEKIP